MDFPVVSTNFLHITLENQLRLEKMTKLMVQNKIKKHLIEFIIILKAQIRITRHICKVINLFKWLADSIINDPIINIKRKTMNIKIYKINDIFISRFSENSYAKIIYYY